MRSFELIQCIKCEGDGYLIWIFPFSFAYTSLLSFSVLVFWCKWLVEEFQRSARFLGSSDDRPLRLSFLDSHPRVKPGLMCKWTFFHPRTGPTYSILYSSPTLPQVISPNISKLKKKNVIYNLV